ncbi:hypothetical protein [Zavarzinella formosa]|uniref:hypothetical protein n=1 Tax=Zavarzinella formosa TaxID=360055 RepID=UPI0012FCD9DB|nr:hypothetical protein [Zavarzinella formosa]
MSANTTQWLAVPEQPDGLSSWSGWAQVSGLTFVTMLQRAFVPGENMDEEELIVTGWKPARILVTNASLPDNRIVFTGNGNYPKAQEEPAFIPNSTNSDKTENYQ